MKESEGAVHASTGVVERGAGVVPRARTREQAVPWAHEVVVRTMTALEAEADVERAAAMSADLGGGLPFVGVGDERRTALLRIAWARLASPSAAELGQAVEHLWRLAGREYQYAACDLLARHLGGRAHRFPAGFLVDVVAPLLRTRPGHDTVDRLRDGAVVPLVGAHPGLAEVLAGWADGDEPWLARAAAGPLLVAAAGGRGGTTASRDGDASRDVTASRAGGTTAG